MISMTLPGEFRGLCIPGSRNCTKAAMGNIYYGAERVDFFGIFCLHVGEWVVMRQAGGWP